MRQAAKNWNEHISTTLLKLGFVQGETDNCLFSKITKHSSTYILVYVDDLLLASTTSEGVQEVKNALNTTYDVRDLGPHIRILRGTSDKRN